MIWCWWLSVRLQKLQYCPTAVSRWASCRFILPHLRSVMFNKKLFENGGLDWHSKVRLVAGLGTWPALCCHPLNRAVLHLEGVMGRFTPCLAEPPPFILDRGSKHPLKILTFVFSSLCPGRFEWNFRKIIFKLILVTDGCDISSEIALKLTSWDLSDDKSTLVQLMAWCHQATSHYLNQCWPKSLPPYGVTRPQWVNGIQIAPVFEIATPLTLKQGAAAAPHFQILDAALMGHLSTVLAFEKWYWQIDKSMF